MKLLALLPQLFIFTFIKVWLYMTFTLGQMLPPCGTWWQWGKRVPKQGRRKEIHIAVLRIWRHIANVARILTSDSYFYIISSPIPTRTGSEKNHHFMLFSIKNRIENTSTQLKHLHFLFSLKNKIENTSTLFRYSGIQDPLSPPYAPGQGPSFFVQWWRRVLRSSERRW